MVVVVVGCCKTWALGGQEGRQGKSCERTGQWMEVRAALVTLAGSFPRSLQLCYSCSPSWHSVDLLAPWDTQAVLDPW